MARLISKVYGDALFDYAIENNCIEKMYEEAVDIHTVFNNSKELVDFLSNPLATIDDKKQMLKSVFLDNIWKGPISKVLSLFHINITKGEDESIMNFLYIIVDKNREKEITDIMDYFMSRVREYKNIGLATVTSAYELKDEQKKILEDKLKNTTKYSDFVIDYVVDTNLISGIKIKIGDRVVDSSIKTKIEEMSKNLRGVRL